MIAFLKRLNLQGELWWRFILKEGCGVEQILKESMVDYVRLFLKFSTLKYRLIQTKFSGSNKVVRQRWIFPPTGVIAV